MSVICFSFSYCRLTDLWMFLHSDYLENQTTLAVADLYSRKNDIQSIRQMARRRTEHKTCMYIVRCPCNIIKRCKINIMICYRFLIVRPSTQVVRNLRKSVCFRPHTTSYWGSYAHGVFVFSSCLDRLRLPHFDSSLITPEGEPSV